MDRGGKKHLTTQDDKAMIMSTQAKQHGGEIKKECGQLRLRVQQTRMNHHNRSDGVSIANCRVELALILLQTVSTMKRELETFL